MRSEHRIRSVLFISSRLYERDRRHRLLMREVAWNCYELAETADLTSELKRALSFMWKHTPARRKSERPKQPSPLEARLPSTPACPRDNAQPWCNPWPPIHGRRI